MALPTNIEEKIVRIPIGGCWLWLGALDQLGYGFACLPGRRVVRAHRAVYEFCRGSIPQGMHLLHRCDVRCCVNPAHLFLGTHVDNMADMVKKGRARNRPRPGESNPLAKLRAEQVIEIRESSEPQRILAARYGIDQSTVSNIKTGRRWRELTV